jgi:hypothetical protein
MPWMCHVVAGVAVMLVVGGESATAMVVEGATAAAV